MYKFVTHTWNAIKGQCIHNCDYCYMKNNWTRFPKQNILRLDEKTLKKTENHKGRKVIYADKCLIDDEHLQFKWANPKEAAKLLKLKFSKELSEKILSL